MAIVKTLSPMWFCLILMGHMTTAPWNMFINNQGWFQGRLNYIEPTKSSQIDLQSAEQDSFSNSTASPKELEQELKCLYDFCIPNKPSTQLTCQWNYDLDQFEKDMQSPDWKKELKANFDNENELLAYQSYKDCMKESGGPVMSPYAKFWASNLSTVSMLISFLSSMICTILVQKMPESTRTYGVWLAVFSIFAINIAMAWLVYSQVAFFAITLSLAAIIIFSGMLFQSTCFSILSTMHFTYIVTLMEGQGLGGIWIAATKIFTGWLEKHLSSPPLNYDKELASNLAITLYWSIALIIIFLTFILWEVVFTKNDDYKESHTSEKSGCEDLDMLEGMSAEKEPLTEQTTSIGFCEILRCIMLQGISLFVTFFICLLLFPGVLSFVRPHDGPQNKLGIVEVDWAYLNISLFLMFNIGDWMGKRLANWAIIKPEQEFLLMGLTLSRGLFYPLILLGLNLTGERTSFLAHKYSFTVINLIFAATSGYMGALPMRFAPIVLEQKLKGKYSDKQIDEAKSKATTYLLCFLLGGLLTGSLCSFLPVEYVSSQNDKINEAAYYKYIFGEE